MNVKSFFYRRTNICLSRKIYETFQRWFSMEFPYETVCFMVTRYSVCDASLRPSVTVVTELPVYLARVFLFSAMLHRSRCHRKWNPPVARACKSVFASTRPTLFADASLWFAFYGSFLAILSVYKLTRLLNSMGNNYSANESSYLRSFIKKHCKGKCLFYRLEN